VLFVVDRALLYCFSSYNAWGKFSPAGTGVRGERLNSMALGYSYTTFGSW